MSFNWNVVQLDYQVAEEGLTDVVTAVHWNVTKEDAEGNVGRVYGSTGVPVPSPDSFTPYDDLTQEQVLGWLFNDVAPINSDDGTWQEEQEAYVDAQLAELENPTTGAGIPW